MAENVAPPPSVQGLKLYICALATLHMPVWNAYKIFCEQHGLIDFPEFEFWYYRFYRGHFDFNYDRRLAPKTRSFTELPVHIFEMVGEHLDMLDRLIVRQVSKTLQSLIDTPTPKISKITVKFWETSSILEFDDEMITFSRGFMSTKKQKLATPTGPHWAHALSYLLPVFQNPKLKLEILGLHYFDVENSERFNKMLQVAQNKICEKSIAQNKKFHVEKLSIIPNYDSMDLNVLMALQYLDKGVLREIDVVNRVDGITDHKKIMEKLVGLEQFQAIQTIECKGKMGGDPGSMAFFLNSPRVSFKLFRKMTAKELSEMIKTLMKSTVLEKFHLSPPDMYNFPAKSLSKMLTQPEFFKAKGVPANIRFHKIQEDQFYKIDITEQLITIEKVEND
ncbi:unnamed protein product [Caenorhabditis brenneri]